MVCTICSICGAKTDDIRWYTATDTPSNPGEQVACMRSNAVSTPSSVSVRNSFWATPRHCRGRPKVWRKALQTEALDPVPSIKPPRYSDRALAIFKGSVRSCPPCCVMTQRRRRFWSSRTNLALSAFRAPLGTPHKRAPPSKTAAPVSPSYPVVHAQTARLAVSKPPPP